MNQNAQHGELRKVKVNMMKSIFSSTIIIVTLVGQAVDDLLRT